MLVKLTPEVKELKSMKEIRTVRQSLITNLILISGFCLAHLFLLFPSRTLQAYRYQCLLQQFQKARPFYIWRCLFLIYKTIQHFGKKINERRAIFFSIQKGAMQIIHFREPCFDRLPCICRDQD